MVEIRYLVTSALPYVNNELHLGQFVGCILPADVFTRFLRLKKEDTIYVCGTDEYGTPIAVAAQKEGLAPKQLADKYYALQKKAIEGFNISADIFSRTTSPEHIKVVQDFYLKLKQNDYIYRKEIEQLYCEKCRRFLPDRYVEGKCPRCGKDARGDQCDVCGNPLEPTQLIEAHCATCGTAPVKKKSEHVFFDLPKAEEKLGEWLENGVDLFANAENFATSFLKGGL
ncbi:MAG: class I tRNA ligase family protein, partial [archaeon]